MKLIEQLISQIVSETLNEKTPKGWEKTVKAMKKHKEIDTPWALVNYMKKKGYKSHKQESKLSESGLQNNVTVPLSKKDSFTGQDLSGKDFSDQDLKGMNFLKLISREQKEFKTVMANNYGKW